MLVASISSLPRLLALLLTCAGFEARAGAAGGRVHIVDSAGSGDFLEIADAVTAALDGDVVLIRSGTYAAFAINGKGLSIVPESGAVVYTGPIEVGNLPEPSDVLLGGLLVRGEEGPAVWLHDCEGTVRLHQLQVLEPAPPWKDAVTNSPALQVELCTDVGVDGCRLPAGDTAPDFDGSHALVARGSSVMLFDSVFLGDEGDEAATFDGDNGGSGAQVDASFLFAARCRFVGRSGGDTYFNNGQGGFGGDGVSLRNGSSLNYTDCDFSHGGGGWAPPCGICEACCWGYAGYDIRLDPSSEAHAFNAPRLLVRGTPTAVAGHSVLLSVTAAPGSAVWTLVGSAGDFRYLPAARGVLAVDVASAAVGFLGIAPPAGPLMQALGVPPLPAGVEGQRFHVQLLALDPTDGTRILGSPQPLVALDCAISEDCNGNGTPDGCEVLSGTGADCDANGVPDECESAKDCDGNGRPDLCDLLDGSSSDCNHNFVPDQCEDHPDCNANGVSDYCDVAEGRSYDCNKNKVPDECEGLPDCNGNGVPDTCDVLDKNSFDRNENGVPDECESLEVIYVDADRPPGGDGQTWKTAYQDLREALEDANASPADFVQVWAADGTYRPNPPQGDRGVSFVVRHGVELYGGFGGWESDLDERDPFQYPTILSGDLDSNDHSGTISDNSFHVVVLEAPLAPARLDGLVIEGGNASAEASKKFGGGIYMPSAGPSARVVIERCTIRDNRAEAWGGGLMLVSSHARVAVQDCALIGNEAGLKGGGFFMEGESFRLVGCTIISNRAGAHGGGIATKEGEFLLFDCRITDNWSDGEAGGLSIGGYYLTITNCTIANNQAGDLGGGIGSDPYTYGFVMNNTIVWGNRSPNVSTVEHDQVFSWAAQYSRFSNDCIEGLYLFPGPNHTGLDPLFEDPDGPDGIPGTLDDDFGLQAGSSCVDNGLNAFLPRDELDLDGDGKHGEPWPFDILGNPRLADDPDAPDQGKPPVVDRGAYERQGG